MVRIAIGEPLVLPESIISYPLHVFCGTKDHLVSEKACRRLIDLIAGGAGINGGVPVATYTSVPNADHSSIMGGEKLSAILLTLQEI